MDSRALADAARLDLATVRVAVGLVDRAKGAPVIPARLAAWGRLTLFHRAYFAANFGLRYGPDGGR